MITGNASFVNYHMTSERLKTKAVTGHSEFQEWHRRTKYEGKTSLAAAALNTVNLEHEDRTSTGAVPARSLQL